MTKQNVIQWAVVCLIVSLTSNVLEAEPAGPKPEQLERMFRNLDQNGDGQIDLKEFVEQHPQARRQRRSDGPLSPEGAMRRPRVEEWERRMHEMIEQRVNEIVERRMHEFVEERLPNIMEERMPCPLGRGPMSDGRPMGRGLGRRWDRPEPWGRDGDRPGRPGGRGWACQPPGPCPAQPDLDRPAGAGGRRGPWPDPGRRSPRGRGADRPRGGSGQRPLFRMFDADHDGKIQAEEIERLADRLREALGLQEGGAITLNDWDKMARERVEKWRQDRRGKKSPRQNKNKNVDEANNP